MNRRGFLKGALAAPIIITTPGLLMPVRKWIESEAEDAGEMIYGHWRVEFFNGESWVEFDGHSGPMVDTSQAHPLALAG